jgi:bifunctional DNA-binding transcriptional regulator/antitoxin component of YhaV-PrlF toxin-antitoxin module
MQPIDPEVFSRLEVTVRQFLDQGTPFSAYNITIATRDRDKIRLRHQELQGDGFTNEGIIHTVCHLRDAIDTGWTAPDGQIVKWSRSQFDLNDGNGTWFWVYHPEGYDITQYQPYSQAQLASIWGVPPSPSPAASVNPPLPSASISLTPIPAHPDSGGDNDDGTFSPDYRSRLLVPTRYLRAAGINAGDEVSVIVDDTNKILMLAADGTNFQGSSVRITTQRVEKWGDLRLSSATLNPLGGDKYRIENGDEQSTPVVKIEPAV